MSIAGVRFAMWLHEVLCARGQHEYGERHYCIHCGIDRGYHE